MTKPSANRVKLFEFKFEIVYLYFQSFKLDIFKLENVKNQVQKDSGPAGAWGLSKIKKIHDKKLIIYYFESLTYHIIHISEYFLPHSYRIQISGGRAR